MVRKNICFLSCKCISTSKSAAETTLPNISVRQTTLSAVCAGRSQKTSRRASQTPYQLDIRCRQRGSEYTRQHVKAMSNVIRTCLQMRVWLKPVTLTFVAGWPLTQWPYQC